MAPVKNLGELRWVFGVFLLKGFGEGGVEDFTADNR